MKNTIMIEYSIRNRNLETKPLYMNLFPCQNKIRKPAIETVIPKISLDLYHTDGGCVCPGFDQKCVKSRFKYRRTHFRSLYAKSLGIN